MSKVEFAGFYKNCSDLFAEGQVAIRAGPHPLPALAQINDLVLVQLREEQAKLQCVVVGQHHACDTLRAALWWCHHRCAAVEALLVRAAHYMGKEAPRMQTRYLGVHVAVVTLEILLRRNDKVFLVVQVVI